MLADFYISRLTNDMKIAIQKKSFWGSNVVQKFGPYQKRRYFQKLYKGVVKMKISTTVLVKMDGVNMSSINWFNISMSRIYPNRSGSVDTGNTNSISRLNRIDQISVSMERNRMGRFSGWHSFGRLLELYNLFANELTPVVNQLHWICYLKYGFIFYAQKVHAILSTVGHVCVRNFLTWSAKFH